MFCPQDFMTRAHGLHAACWLSLPWYSVTVSILHNLDMPQLLWTTARVVFLALSGASPQSNTSI